MKQQIRDEMKEALSQHQVAWGTVYRDSFLGGVMVKYHRISERGGMD